MFWLYYHEGQHEFKDDDIVGICLIKTLVLFYFIRMQCNRIYVSVDWVGTKEDNVIYEQRLEMFVVSRKKHGSNKRPSEFPLLSLHDSQSSQSELREVVLYNSAPTPVK